VPLQFTCDPGVRADVRAELRRLTTYFERVSPVPHDIEVAARRARRIVRPDGRWAYGSEGDHPEATGRRLICVATLAREEAEAFAPIFDLYGWGDYVLVAGHLLLCELARYEQFRDGHGRDDGAATQRAMDLYDQLGLPTLPWSRHAR
jgi:hypothetical protein